MSGSLDDLRARKLGRSICRRCKTAPHTVRVRLEVREKSAGGAGKGVTSSTTSLCAACAGEMLDQFEGETS